MGWGSLRTLAQLLIAIGLLLAFLVIETRVKTPLMPLRLFRLRNLAIANIVGCSGRSRCSPGSSCRRCTCSWCWATHPLKWGSHSFPPT
ncbi:hypothetical protein QNM99_11620 [Pseudomonas sp. PCH446]